MKYGVRAVVATIAVFVAGYATATVVAYADDGDVTCCETYPPLNDTSDNPAPTPHSGAPVIAVLDPRPGVNGKN